MTPDELADRLEHASDRVGNTLYQAVKHTGTIGNARIRGNASDRPGPNVITGQYRNSWRSVTNRIPYGAQCTIGTAAPQGRRLEFGFMGMTDSLGRTYHQPPFPHAGPALPVITTVLRGQVALAVREILS
ncbi:HK97 gp10 family phage protein [Streptomyces sp. NRRL F-5135]|uniref:HK97 gp10 family phage protein n=1 Tax=Streptomyces sp. NRRL F-5135 TaxID=1463858 RepID=UPI0004CB7583|nr:HK97 gp10 family phage protein [Streptomyces sp. NRRL F-5135]